MTDPGSPPPSPWARPVDGQPPVVFELRPNVPEPPLAPAARRSWKIAGAVVLAAVLALAGVLVARRGGTEVELAAGAHELDAQADPDAVAPGTFDLAALPDRVDGPRRFTTRIGATTASSYQIEGELDRSRRLRATITVGLGDPIDVIYDVGGDRAYLRGGPYADVGSGGTAWIAVGLADLLDAAGQRFADVEASLGLASERQLAIQFGAAPAPLTLTQVGGEQVMMYAVELTKDEFVRGSNASVTSAMNTAVAGMIDHMASLTYRVAVTEDNHLRQAELRFVLDDGVVVPVTTDFLPVEPDFEVTIPDPADVELVDVSQLG